MKCRKRWYVTDFWEEFHVIPVKITGKIGRREYAVVWELGDGLTHEYRASRKDIFTTKTRAAREARRKNEKNRTIIY